MYSISTRPMGSPPRPYHPRNRRSSRSHSRGRRTTASVAQVPTGQDASSTQSRNTIPSMAIDVPSITELNPSENGRQEAPTEDSSNKHLKQFMISFYVFEYLMLIALFVVFMATQVFNGEIDIAFIIFEVMVAVHLLVSLRNHFLYTSAQEKRENLYRVLEDILYIVLLFCLDNGDAVTNGVSGALLAVIIVVIINYEAKCFYMLSVDKAAGSGFIRYTGILFFLIRFMVVAQVILALLKCGNVVSFDWIFVCIPVLCVAGLLALHAVFMLRITMSKIGRLILIDLTMRQFFGLCWMYLVPLVIGGFLTWSAFFVSNILQNPDTYDRDSRPFFVLLLPMIAATLLVILYTHYFEGSIIMIIKSFIGLFDLSPSDREKVQVLVKELKEKEAEDNYKPEFLIKISNAFFKVPTKEEVRKEKKIKDKKEKKESKKNKLEKSVDKKEGKQDPKDYSIAEKCQGNKNKSLNSMEDLEKGDTSTTKCVICFDSEQDAVYLPCGHGGVCYTCAQEVIKSKGECHLCRGPVRRLAKIDPGTIQTNQVKVISIAKTIQIVSAAAAP